jgi:hypothetical protein
MKRPDVRYAMVSREWGLRRVRRLTWGVASAGAVGAVALVVGFGGHLHLPKFNQHVQGSQAPAGDQGSSGTQQPVGGGQLQPPAANPAPARGPAHVASGGS